MAGRVYFRVLGQLTVEGQEADGGGGNEAGDGTHFLRFVNDSTQDL